MKAANGVMYQSEMAGLFLEYGHGLPMPIAQQSFRFDHTGLFTSSSSLEC